MSFADRVDSAVQTAYLMHQPFQPSKAEIEESLKPIIDALHQMPHEEAVAYIRESYTHTGYQALAVRMFKDQPT